jgi:hypothetical protein
MVNEPEQLDVWACIAEAAKAQDPTVDAEDLAKTLREKEKEDNERELEKQRRYRSGRVVIEHDEGS